MGCLLSAQGSLFALDYYSQLMTQDRGPPPTEIQGNFPREAGSP